MNLLLKVSLFALVSLVLISNVGGQSKVKPANALAEKVGQLTSLAAKKPVIRLNGQKFRDFVKTAPKNYSMIIMFTALAANRQCVICRNAYDEYVIAANSYRMGSSYSNKLFFAMVDFDEGSDVFQMMRLNTAPVFMHFPAKGKVKGADTMDIQRVGFQAESIAKWIQERTEVSIRVFRPPNYTATIAMLLFISLGAAFLYVKRNNLEFLKNPRMWGSLAVFFCLAMVSGQMWNHIRGPPFFHKSSNGGVVYIHGSSQGQLVVETYIVIFLNAMIFLGMVLLIETKKQVDSRKARAMAIAGLILVVTFYSLILSVFRAKAQGYPYSFLFK